MTTGTATADRANIRALRKDLKRTANMVAMPSMADRVCGGVPFANESHHANEPHANDNGEARS